MEKLFQSHDTLVMTGGSMLYADAVCNGLDDLKNPTPALPSGEGEERENLREKGLEWLQNEVQRLDPEYWERVDRNNPARLAHCVEICYATGKPYSSLLTHTAKKRPFRIIKIGLERPREELYDRINRRVEQMIADGLEQEARAVYPLRKLNSLRIRPRESHRTDTTELAPLCQTADDVVQKR